MGKRKKQRGQNRFHNPTSDKDNEDSDRESDRDDNTEEDTITKRRYQVENRKRVARTMMNQDSSSIWNNEGFINLQVKDNDYYYGTMNLNVEEREMSPMSESEVYENILLLLLFHMDYLYIRCILAAFHTPPVSLGNGATSSR